MKGSWRDYITLTPDSGTVAYPRHLLSRGCFQRVSVNAREQ